MSRERNEGIQGNVTADIVAVGRNARAVKTVNTTNAAELHSAVQSLAEGIGKLPVQAAAKDALQSDIRQLEAAAKTPGVQPDHVSGILQSMAGKLKMVGVVLTSAVELSGPVMKIAGALHTTVSALGL